MFGNKQQLPDYARVENNAVRNIDYGHCAVHDDQYCKANDYFTPLQQNATRDYLIVPPEGLELHLDNLNIAPSAAVMVEVYRNPIATGGTAVLHHRLNGWSKKNLITTYHTPVITNLGTLVERERINGSTQNQTASRIGGENQKGEEIIVPGNQKLLVRFIGIVNDTNLTFKAGYYEVTDGATRP
jgi:hypothetical protein